MKKTILILAVLIAAELTVFATGELPVDSNTKGDILPIKSVTLYSAGLAWIVREAKVKDDQVLSFAVDQNDVNDMLKSLTVEDLGGGTVDSVNFESENPLAVVLSDLRVNPSGSPDLVDFLKRIQGEEVSVFTDGKTRSGRIFSVEVVNNGDTRKVILNLMDRSGINPVDISTISNLSFRDAALQKELLSALDLISRSRVKSSRTLKISLRGKGERTIRLSYIRAVPLWKTSYRITLDEKGVPRLEGWALVQNTGSSDWSDVTLSFVAGQPNAFTIDLATPRYVPRQNVQTATAAPIGSTSYEKAYAAPAPAAPSARKSYESAAPPSALDFASPAESYTPAPVQSQATGHDTGNFYRYTVNHPVTVEGRSSAMIPILSVPDVGESLAVYDPKYNLVFKGIRLKNNSDADWEAGPATVEEGRWYGGDVMIPSMISGAERLVTYAVHGSVKVDKIETAEPQRIVSLKMLNGLLERTDKITKKTEYRITGKDRELLLIHRKTSGWDLVEHPPIAEETASEYRFDLTDWKDPVIVREEHVISRQYSLASMNIRDIQTYLQWEGISRQMKSAFDELSALLNHMQSIRSDISGLNSQLSRLERDQNRVRENMKVLDKDSDLYKRYASQLGDQETQIRKINTDLTTKQTDLADADKKLKDYISGLDLE